MATAAAAKPSVGHSSLKLACSFGTAGADRYHRPKIDLRILIRMTPSLSWKAATDFDLETTISTDSTAPYPRLLPLIPA